MILNKNKFVCRAIDNRMGGFMIAEVARLLKENNKKLPFGLYITNSGDDHYVKEYYKKREATDDGFLDSMMMGYLTNSTLMGTLHGGNPAGAMLGDALNNFDEVQEKTPTFEPETQEIGKELGEAADESIANIEPFS